MKKMITGILAMVSLALCLLFPALLFLDVIPARIFRTAFLSASAGWFVFAVLYPKKKRS